MSELCSINVIFHSFMYTQAQINLKNDLIYSCTIYEIFYQKSNLKRRGRWSVNTGVKGSGNFFIFMLHNYICKVTVNCCLQFAKTSHACKDFSCLQRLPILFLLNQILFIYFFNTVQIQGSSATQDSALLNGDVVRVYREVARMHIIRICRIDNI